MALLSSTVSVLLISGELKARNRSSPCSRSLAYFLKMAEALLASGLSMKMVVLGTLPCSMSQHKIGHHLLRALDREGRNEKRALAGCCGIHFRGQQFAALVFRAFKAVVAAIGRFTDDIVKACWRLRGPAPASCGRGRCRRRTECAAGLAGLCYLHFNGGRSQEMAGSSTSGRECPWRVQSMFRIQAPSKCSRDFCASSSV